MTSIRPYYLLLLALASVSAPLVPCPANAAMQLCNRTSYILYAAVGFQSGTAMTTQGWTRLAPGACQSPISQPPAGSNFYLLARTSQAHNGPARIWGGTAQLCVKDGNFVLKTPFGTAACKGDESFNMPFSLVDTHGMKSWSTTFTESPDLGSMDAARIAGTKRLLADAGYKVGAPNVKPDKAAAKALGQFRTRMKLAANATADDLFDALETEALKIAAPAGYSICNDSDQALWAALGLKSGSDWVSRGWWKIAPGICAKAITAPLSTDKVYLLAERPGGQRLVQGKAKFCVTNVQFEIFGRERCASRGTKEAGFAETNTKGVAGYSAHVGAEDLVGPATQSQAATPK